MRAKRAQVLRRGCSAITNVRLPKASGLLHPTSRGLFRTIATFLIICSLPTHFKSQPTTERQLCGTAGKWLMLTAPMRSTAGRHYNQVSRAYWQIHSLYFRIFPYSGVLFADSRPTPTIRYAAKVLHTSGRLKRGHVRAVTRQPREHQLHCASQRFRNQASLLPH